MGRCSVAVIKRAASAALNTVQQKIHQKTSSYESIREQCITEKQTTLFNALRLKNIHYK